MLAGKDEQANEVFAKVCASIKRVTEEEGIVCFDWYKAFEEENRSHTDNERKRGITTRDGYKLNDEGEELAMSLFLEAFSLSKGSASRELKEGDVVGLMAPFLPKQFNHFSVQLKEKYKDMGILAPRAVGFMITKDLFRSKLADLDKLKSNKPTLLFIYPGQSILGSVGRNRASLDDGVFKTKFKEKIELIRESLPECAIYVMTPLVWREIVGEHKVKIGGPNFKACEQWAQQSREVAAELGLPVIDLHAKCLSFIQKNGVDEAAFAGIRDKSFEREGLKMLFEGKRVSNVP